MLLDLWKMTGASRISFMTLWCQVVLLENTVSLLHARVPPFDRLHQLTQQTFGAPTFFSHVTDKILLDSALFAEGCPAVTSRKNS